ncbi:MAG: hypothetical protein LBI95_01320, partial [Holosporales bacterium]|nr:hypothetical protein [Holosporales bacterium]
IGSYPSNEGVSCVVVERSFSDKAITMGESYNFEGARKELGVGEYASSQLGIKDNQLSSIFVPKGFVVILYDEDKFKGDSLAICAEKSNMEIANLTNIFEKKTSSIIVSKVE